VTAEFDFIAHDKAEQRILEALHSLFGSAGRRLGPSPKLACTLPHAVVDVLAVKGRVTYTLQRRLLRRTGCP
jgi:hypothetical protein